MSDGAELNIVQHVAVRVGGVSGDALERYLANGGSTDTMASLYLHLMAQRFGAGGRIVDKTVDASRFVGLIAAALPDAPLIWMRRDPLDSAWSCLRTFFIHGVAWSYDLTDIAHHFRLEDALLAFWKARLGERLLVVRYGELVDSPRGWTSRILSHCGLEDEPGVYTPHATDRDGCRRSAGRCGRKRGDDQSDRPGRRDGLAGGGISGLTTGVNGSGNNDIGVPAVQLNGKNASKVLCANSSVVKALGGTVASPNNFDGNVTFSSNFSFDFNPSNGITAGQMDFIGVAIHEIGHALGFVSGVDFFDYYSFPNGPGKGSLGYDLNDTSVFSALDMFRYGAPGQIDLTVGGTKYFSIDGGATALFGNTLSTGAYNGDGRQASHWRDATGCGAQLGIMDPTFCYGQMGFITGLDLAAYDAMGWNLSVDALQYAGVSTADIYTTAVPEPSTWALMFAGLGLMGLVARRSARPT